eukprot:CAMPEP_0119114706 /NCGR_PEP_ID=MMETSP1180-20130426/48326_1 /TAXON_ID=3052 ORGANISM="Chlamydomonas cf sp, Strain CCMP681" /NCGR_SAMPLE_ID=MMETSP1180 /ASSEMBLY_ACC=CAM_ASM_000741 /LENGTH=49 /DNA_ID=CAMNT_0007103361 /DNA_START=27 /DNA_END=176 /DNA_ORIENTATION=+
MVQGSASVMASQLHPSADLLYYDVRKKTSCSTPPSSAQVANPVSIKYQQ